MERANFKTNGIQVHFRPWRAVAHAYNADLHYRVHLHVDGLPPFAWRPEIVDQLLARRCAVQRLDDGFTTMEVTSSFGLWAWTPDPQRIPKVLWCTFTNKAPGGLSSLASVSEDRPDHSSRIRGTVYRPMTRDRRPGSRFGVEVRYDRSRCWERVPGQSVLYPGSATQYSRFSIKKIAIRYWNRKL
jgi:hypothetical protein